MCEIIQGSYVIELEIILHVYTRKSITDVSFIFVTSTHHCLMKFLETMAMDVYRNDPGHH